MTPGPPPPEPNVAPFAEATRKALEAKKITIDLMFLYTKNAADHYLGEPADLLTLAVEEASAVRSARARSVGGTLSPSAFAVGGLELNFRGLMHRKLNGA